jgi:SAM-dependent methyltransferase
MSRQPRCLAALSEEELRQLTSVTLAHYHDRARAFWRGTHDHDVSQNVAALLRHLPGPAPRAILDLGCGPGRDLITFRDLGHEPVGLDGALAFVEMAREGSGCPVLHQDFLALDLPPERFHGIFANASLFHVPSQELPRVLGELWRSLVPDGVLFASNPHGPNREGWSGDRYSCYLDLDEWRQFASSAHFIELEHYYRPPGQPRHLQPWLATVWRKRTG